MMVEVAPSPRPGVSYHIGRLANPDSDDDDDEDDHGGGIVAGSRSPGHVRGRARNSGAPQGPRVFGPDQGTRETHAASRVVVTSRSRHWNRAIATRAAGGRRAESGSSGSSGSAVDSLRRLSSARVLALRTPAMFAGGVGRISNGGGAVPVSASAAAPAGVIGGSALSGTTSAAGDAEPSLDPRSLRLLHLHARFLLWFIGAVALGLIAHAGKVFRVSSSVSVDGYEDLFAVARHRVCERASLAFLAEGPPPEGRARTTPPSDDEGASGAAPAAGTTASPRDESIALRVIGNADRSHAALPSSAKAPVALSLGNLAALDFLRPPPEAEELRAWCRVTASGAGAAIRLALEAAAAAAATAPAASSAANTANICPSAEDESHGPEGESAEAGFVYFGGPYMAAEGAGERSAGGAEGDGGAAAGVRAKNGSSGCSEPRASRGTPNAGSAFVASVEHFRRARQLRVAPLLRALSAGECAVRPANARGGGRWEGEEASPAAAVVQYAALRLLERHPRLLALLPTASAPTVADRPLSLPLSAMLHQVRRAGLHLYAVDNHAAPFGLSDPAVWAFRTFLLPMRFLAPRRETAAAERLAISAGSLRRAELAATDAATAARATALAAGPSIAKWRFREYLFGAVADAGDNAADNSAPGGGKLLFLFRATGGTFSPVYPLSQFIVWLFGRRGAVYLWLLLLWLPSLVSPQPVTLLHFPRLMSYVGILAYRYVTLYLPGAIYQRRFGAFPGGLEFSDHIVLFMALGLVLSLEIAAAERAHPLKQLDSGGGPNGRQAAPARPQWPSAAPPGARPPFAGGGPGPPGLGPPTRPGTGVLRFYQEMMAKRREHRAAWRDRFYRPEPRSLWGRAAQQLCSRGGEAPAGGGLTAATAWAPPVLFARALGLLLALVLCASAFFTAALFHHRREAVLGVLVGLAGLYAPFWIAVYAGLLTMDRLRVPRDRPAERAAR